MPASNFDTYTQHFRRDRLLVGDIEKERTALNDLASESASVQVPRAAEFFPGLDPIDAVATRLLENPKELESPVKTALLLLGSGSASESAPSLEATILRGLEQIESGIARVLDREPACAYENAMLRNRDAEDRLRDIASLKFMGGDSTAEKGSRSTLVRFLEESERAQREAEWRLREMKSTPQSARAGQAPQDSHSLRPNGGATD